MTSVTKSMISSLFLIIVVAGLDIIGWWAAVIRLWVPMGIMTGLTIIAVISIVPLVPDVVRGLNHIVDEAAREID